MDYVCLAATKRQQSSGAAGTKTKKNQYGVSMQLFGLSLRPNPSTRTSPSVKAGY